MTAMFFFKLTTNATHSDALQHLEESDSDRKFILIYTNKYFGSRKDSQQALARFSGSRDFEC